MKNMFKKLLLSLMLATAIKANAASTSVTVAAGVMTNFTFISQGSVKITSVLLTSLTTNISSIQLIDTFTNRLNYTNSAYSNILTYATNYVSVWTNYYGVTNTVTNSGSLVDVTNSVAGTTNSYPVLLIATTPTNSSTRVDSVNLYAVHGVWVTNTGTGNAAVTVVYQQ